MIKKLNNYLNGMVWYGIVRLIKKDLWKKIPKLYQFFLLKEAGHISYMVTALPMHNQYKLS
jgi:hypothetical protein